MGRRPVVALALVLVLFAVACGDDEDSGTTDTTVAEVPGKGEPVTVEVDAAEDVQDLNLATLAYFPNELTVAAGDTVVFRSNDTG